MIPIQFIIQAHEAEQCINLAEQALQGGCKWIQMQTSSLCATEAESTARYLLESCHQNQANFIIESDISLCKKIKADGVCLTEEDKPANEIREELGHDYIIGANAHSFEQINLLKRMSADYVLLPFTDKNDTISISQQVKEANLRLPICTYMPSAQIDVMMELINAGIDGIAIASETLQQHDVKQTIELLLHADE